MGRRRTAAPITWCPGQLSREEIEGVGFNYGSYAEMSEHYNPDKLSHGYNRLDGEELFFVSNPGWGCGRISRG